MAKHTAHTYPRLPQNRFLQIGILVYAIFTLFFNATWAYNEYPLGTVNAWSEPGNIEALLGNDYDSAHSYCSNPSHAFDYSESFMYAMPECRFLPAYQLMTKGVGRVDITSHFLVYDTEGFPCDTADYASIAGNCTATGGSLGTYPPTNQCECVHTQSLYPIGIENMVVAFGHAYKLPDQSKAGLRDWSGTSSMGSGLTSHTNELLPTEIRFSSPNPDWNVEDIVFPSGVAGVAT
jgi:hypothetical protein